MEGSTLIFPIVVMAVGMWGVIRFGRRPLTPRELEVAERARVQTLLVALLLRGIHRHFGGLGVRIALLLTFLAIFVLGAVSLLGGFN
jgi:hypothetical protein